MFRADLALVGFGHVGRRFALLLDEWRAAGDYRRIKCIELLLVCGWGNREVAQHLQMTEQQVANYKFQVVERLARRSRQPEAK